MATDALTTEEQCVEVDETGSLSGGDVLPGFELSMADLFKVRKARPS